MVNAQEWLDQNYPKEKRKNIRELNISDKSLEGDLDLNDFINLERLDCHNNLLTLLSFSNCLKLRKINCINNKLNKLDLSNNLGFEELDSHENNQLTNISLPLKVEELSYLGFNKFNGQSSVYDDSFLDDCLDYSILLNNCENWATKLSPLTCGSWRTRSSYEDLKVNGQLSYFRKGELYKRIANNNDFFYNIRDWRESQVGFQQLKQAVTKIDPSLKIYDVIERLDFFDARTGSFRGDLNAILFLFQNNISRISFLESNIIDLTNLIKNQKEKIVNAYLHFFTEKELLKELIADYLEYKKAQKQGLDNVIELRKKYNKLQEELEEKINEKQALEVEQILKNCEELIHYETELQTQINQNQKLIEGHSKIINQITYNIGSINVKRGNALIDNNIGDNSNITNEYVVRKILETSIEAPPK